MKQKQQTKNKHSGSTRARSDQRPMDKQNRLKSTLEGKINRIETFIESANEKTDWVEIKVKLRSLIQLKKKRVGTSQQLLCHSECERCRVNCRRRRSPSS
ncbi:hypothetical protein TNCV_1378931 [Trichonephila clavipes]|nr:hypothetical protein TNCV_1378931 [Trichonephila clavipes]